VIDRATRNKHVDAMLGIGILFVVMGHRYQPDSLFFPAYTFHMGLFFFISGYLATIRTNWREKLELARRKSRSQLLRYFQYNLFFAVLTWALAQIGIELGYNIPVFKSTTTVLASVRDFFLVPFLDGHQYLLYLAAWFILQLYLVHLLFQAVMWSARRGCVLAVLALTIPVTLLLLQAGLGDYTDLRLTGVRTSFAFLFYLFGYIIKREEPTLGKLLRSPGLLAVEFVLVNVLAINFGNIRYNIVLGDIGNSRVWVPPCTTLLIVLMVFQIAWHLAGWISESAFLLRLGRATLPILVWHFTIFFLINVALFAAGLVTFKDLSNNWFILNPKQTWLLYEVPALLAPLWIDRGIGWLAMRVGLSRDGSF